jgi:hypothetical protein
VPIDNSDYEKAVRSWLMSSVIDQTEDYLRRGRRFSDLETDVLKEQWIVAFKKHCRDFEDVALNRKSNDLQAELALRSIDPPFDVVEADLGRMTAAIRESVDDIKLNRPEIWKEGEELARAEFEKFLKSHSKPKT